MCDLAPLVADGDVDVRGRLADAVAAPLGARREALQRRALLDVDRLDLELVDVGAVVVLGVGDRRLERLLDDPGGALLREVEDVDRLVDLLAADEVGDQPALVGGEANAANDRFGFHRGHPYFFEAFLSAGWPLKVRVSANSPSLWPTIWSVTYTGMCCLPLCT